MQITSTIPAPAVTPFSMIVGFGAQAIEGNTPQAYGVIQSLGANLGVQFNDVHVANRGAFGEMTGTISGSAEGVQQALRSIELFSNRFTYAG